jgi:dipeptidyl aminopeptidase/acylaminoacyl peptidase
VLGQGHWELTRRYREQGFIAMTPALRGENGLPGVYSGFYDEVRDVLAAAERLAELPGVDRNRIFLAGHSVGGVHTLLSALTTNRFKAAAAFSGNANAWRFFERFPEMICFDASDRREFEMRSAICFPGSFKVPVRITFGSEETRLAGPSQELAHRAKLAGRDVEAARVPGDHSSALPGEIELSIAFFRAFG